MAGRSVFDHQLPHCQYAWRDCREISVHVNASAQRKAKLDRAPGRHSTTHRARGNTEYMVRVGIVAWVILVASVVRGAAPTFVADPGAARSLVVMAQVALEAQRPEEAARLFERAFELDPQGLFLVGAGTGWLQAMRPAEALAQVERALRDVRLVDPERAQTTRLADVARSLVPLVAQARGATARGDHGAAMAAWEKAFERWPNGLALIEAARAAQRAERARDLRRLAVEAAARDDLGSDDRRWVSEVLDDFARSDAEDRRPLREDSVAPWVLVGVGATVVIGGAVGLALGADARDDVRAMKGDARGGVVFDTTRAEAQERSDDARLFTTIGWVGVGVGAVVLAVGSGWLLAQEPVATTRVDTVTIDWGVFATPAGGVVSAYGSF